MSEIIKKEQVPMTMDALESLCKIAMESKAYKDMSQPLMMNIMLTARDLGISPMKALNGGFYIVNGKVCMSSGLMAEMIRSAGHSMRIKLTDEKCIILGTRKDNGDTLELEYSMKDAERAGLLASPTWKKFPKQMMYNRAVSTIARMLFTDVIGNSYSSEDEMYDIDGTPSTRRPLLEPATREFNQKLALPEPFPNRTQDLCDELQRHFPDLELAYVEQFLEKKSREWNKPVNAIVAHALDSEEKFMKFKDMIFESRVELPEE